MFPWTLGTSNRVHFDKDGHEVEPVQHACTTDPYSRTGGTYRALCGRQVRMRRGDRFDSKHERACRDCAKLVDA